MKVEYEKHEKEKRAGTLKILTSAPADEHTPFFFWFLGAGGGGVEVIGDA